MECIYCKKEIDRHGNGRYCPEKNGIKDYCYKEEKKIRQKTLLIAKAKAIEIQNQLIGTLEGILQGNEEAKLNSLNFLKKYFDNGYFQEYTVNNYNVFKFKNFQLSKVEFSGNEPKYKLKKITNQNEFKL